MVAVNYPSIPNFYDPEAVMQATQRGYQAGKDWRDEKSAAATFGKYLESLYGGPAGGSMAQSAAPQMLSSLGQQFTAPAPGAVQRAPLPPPVDPASARVEQAFAAQGQGTSPDAIAGRFLKTVRDGGLTNPYALAAVAATGKNESGYAADKAFGTWSDPSQSGQAGTSGGIMSWRADRLANLQKFAADNGDDPNRPSPETQGKFLLAEDPSLIQRLQAAKSPQEASSIMADAWKFAGYNQPGGEAAQRVADTQTYLPQFGGTPSQQALQNLAVGQSVPAGGPAQVADASGAAPAPTGSILPPREVMGELFANPVTRPFAVDLAKAAQGLRIDANDPQKQLEYQIAVEKLRALQANGGMQVPEGYRRSANGGLEAIPGGPADPSNPLNLKKTTPGNGITIGPDGTVQIGGGAQKLTEGQSKDLGYYTRGLDAEAQLSGQDTQLANWGQQNADKIPLGLGNYLRTPEFRQAKQAADSFLTAILRKDTGAAITNKEFEQYGPLFLPVPGDDDGTIAQKRRARQVALLAIRSGLGTAEAVAKANEISLGLATPNPGKGDRVTEPQTKRTSTGVQWSIEP